MTPPEVHDFLYDIGSDWKGQGCAIELGCWLGGSAVPLLEGLHLARFDRTFWAFDSWTADQDQVRKAAKQGQDLHICQDLLPIFRSNVTPVYGKVSAVRGRLPGSLHWWVSEPIEICIFDAPKKNPIFIESIKRLEPHFIPGVTILGLLDYYSYKKPGAGSEKRKAPVNFINDNPDSFTMLKDWPGECSCTFFQYKKPVIWKQ